MGILVNHEDQAGTWLSQGLWQGFPADEIFGMRTRRAGVGILDDFMNLGLTGGQYKLLQTGTGTAKQVDGLGGLCQLLTTADNDEGVIIGGGDTGAPFLLSSTAPKELVYEARFKVDSIAASMSDVFVGLGEAGMGTNVQLFTDADAMADNDYLGFHRIAAATSGLTFGWRRSGQAAQTYATAVHTLVADTYVKAGFRFSQVSKTITPWINGVAIPAGKINLNTAAVAALFPNDYLTVLAGNKGIDAADHTVTLDWWACAQLV